MENKGRIYYKKGEYIYTDTLLTKPGYEEVQTIKIVQITDGGLIDLQNHHLDDDEINYLIKDEENYLYDYEEYLYSSPEELIRKINRLTHKSEPTYRIIAYDPHPQRCGRYEAICRDGEILDENNIECFFSDADISLQEICQCSEVNYVYTDIDGTEYEGIIHIQEEAEAEEGEDDGEVELNCRQFVDNLSTIENITEDIPDEELEIIEL